MSDATIVNKINTSLREFQTDYSVEVISSSLIKNNIQESQLIFQTLGTSKRAHKKDTSRINIIEDIEELFFIYTNREGLYDSLPEFIFHYPINNYSSSNTAEIIEGIKRFRQEERHARLFFLPYEQEFFRIKNLFQKSIEDFESPILNQKKQTLLTICWPIFAKLDTVSGYIFLCLFPHIHTFRDNFKKIAECLSIILNIPLKISTSTTQIVHPQSKNSLNTSRLGIDFIIGTSMFDGEKDVYIEVGPLSKEAHRSFLPGGSRFNLIEELCDFFIGANYFVMVTYTCEKPEEAVSLNEECLLGIDTYI